MIFINIIIDIMIDMIGKSWHVHNICYSITHVRILLNATTYMFIEQPL